MTRKQYILLMQGEPNGSYDFMKSCIVSKDIDKLDEWFEGVISSLWYRVNHKLLVLYGKQGTGKTLFLEKTLAANTISTLLARMNIYQDLIINLDEVKSKTEIAETRRLIAHEGFVINDMPGDYPSCEKRLSSFATTTNNPKEFIGAKRAICVEIISINFDLINTIDTKLLWIDIYNKFINLEYGK